jgi:hypothetical protein
VVGGGAVGVLDCRWEAAEAVVNDEQELRWSSSKASCSGRRRRSRMGVRECKSESVGSLGMNFKSRRRHGERELLLASRRHTWTLGRRRRNVEEQGEGQRGVGSGGRGAGAARGAKRGATGQLGLRHLAGKGGEGGAKRNKERRTGGRRRRTNMQVSKSAGTLL